MPDYAITLTPQQRRRLEQVRLATGCRSIEEALQLLLDTVLPVNSNGSGQVTTQQGPGLRHKTGGGQ